MKIRPLHDRVVVKRKDEETRTAGGLYIPESAKERPVEAEVIAIGHGKVLEDGTLRPLALKVGDKVLFGKYAGNEIKLNDVEYLIMREEDILAVIE